VPHVGPPTHMRSFSTDEASAVHLPQKRWSEFNISIVLISCMHSQFHPAILLFSFIFNSYSFFYNIAATKESIRHKKLIYHHIQDAKILLLMAINSNKNKKNRTNAWNNKLLSNAQERSTCSRSREKSMV